MTKTEIERLKKEVSPEEAEKELGRRLCRESYTAYCYHVHRGSWKPTRFHTWLTKYVQAWLESDTGHAYDILCLSVPPQHGKSVTLTETLPSWYVGKKPNDRVIIVSYNETFAGKFGRRNKTKIDEYGKDIFGARWIKATDTEMELAYHSGGILSRGVLSGITGNPANLMIIDDPIKTREESDSPTMRDKIWDEWESSMRTRLAAGAKVICIMTRWHEDDLFGRLSRWEKNVTVVNIPCEAEEGDVLGRKVGDALCPELGKDNDWMCEVKEANSGGNRTWYALYQGSPVIEGGNILKEEWWRYYDKLPDEFDHQIISVDCAFKDKPANDFVAIGVWGKKGPNVYLIDAINQHLEFLETVEAIKSIKEKYSKATAILVEDKANGTAVINTLRKQIPGIISITPKDGKVARVYAVTPYIEGGNVYLPKFAAFKSEFITQCSAFPNAEHDDLVDEMSQALDYLFRKPEVVVKEEKSALQLHREQALGLTRRRRR